MDLHKQVARRVPGQNALYGFHELPKARVILGEQVGRIDLLQWVVYKAAERVVRALVGDVCLGDGQGVRRNADIRKRQLVYVAVAGEARGVRSAGFHSDFYAPVDFVQPGDHPVGTRGDPCRRQRQQRVRRVIGIVSLDEATTGFHTQPQPAVRRHLEAVCRLGIHPAA